MCRRHFFKDIFGKMKDYEYNEKLMKLHFMGGGAGNRVHGENGATQASGVAASVNKDERSRDEDFKQQTKQMEVVTEEDDVEENEFLDTDLF